MYNIQNIVFQHVVLSKLHDNQITVSFKTGIKRDYVDEWSQLRRYQFQIVDCYTILVK